MTTIATPSTRLRLTVRGRRVLAAVAALPAVIAIVFAALSGGAALAARDADGPTQTYGEITVMAGESLWSIAQEVAPASDPRDVVAEISRLNALDGGVITAGQRLAIPTSLDTAP